MTRSKLREHVFKALFQAEFYSSDEMSKQIEVYLETLDPISEEDNAYIEDKVSKILDKKAELDESIDKKSTGWKISRMGKVELTILRLAVYEMLYDEEIPTSVAIDQAVELSKVFGGDQSPAFVNGVLAKFA